MTPRDHERTLLTRRRLLGVVPAGAALVTLSACGGPAPTYSLGAGEDRGFFSEFAQLLSQAVERSDAAFSLDTRPTAGSVANLELLRNEDVDVALALADVAVTETQELRTLGRVYLNYVQLAVPADSSVQRMKDLRGKTVSLGPSNSGTEFTGRRVLAASGLGQSDVELVQLPLTQVREALMAGEVHAALFAGGVPNPVIDAAEGTDAGIRLVDLSSELKVLQERYGTVYEAVTLPPGIYGSDREVPSIGVASLLVTRPELPDHVGRGTVEVLARQSDRLVPSGTAGVQYLDPRSLIYTFSIPLHPGAAAAYRDIHG